MDNIEYFDGCFDTDPSRMNECDDDDDDGEVNDGDDDEKEDEATSRVVFERDTSVFDPTGVVSAMAYANRCRRYNPLRVGGIEYPRCLLIEE
jgi:hypothetical protein